MYAMHRSRKTSAHQTEKEVLAQTLGAAVLITISGERAADAGDVVLIDAPEGYTYESFQITNKETRKVWSDGESILKR